MALVAPEPQLASEACLPEREGSASVCALRKLALEVVAVDFKLFEPGSMKSVAQR